MIIPSNQPISFKEYRLFKDSSWRFRQLISKSDVSHFQVYVNDDLLADDTTPIINEDFTSGIGSWTVAGGAWGTSSNKATYSNQVESQFYRAVLTTSDKYQVTIKVDALSGVDYINVNIGEGNTIQQIAEPGTYVITGVATDNRFEIAVPAEPDESVSIEIDTIEVLTVYTYDISSYFKAGIMDMNNNMIKVIDLDSSWIVDGNIITFKVDWATHGLADGCYKIALFDPNKNWYSQNYLEPEDFNQTGLLSLWGYTETSGASNNIQLSGGGVTFGFAAINTPSDITKKAVRDGCSYDIEIDIDTISNAEVEVHIGSNQSASYTTTGTKTFTLVADGNDIKVQVDNTSASATCRISRIKITPQLSFMIPDYESEPLIYKNFANFETIQIEATCDQDAMGMYFTDTDFQPSIRVLGEISGLIPEVDVIRAANSSGKSFTEFFDGNYKEVLKIDNAPMRIHKAVLMLAGMNHKAINGEPYEIYPDEFGVASIDVVEDTHTSNISVRKRTHQAILKDDVRTASRSLTEAELLGDGWENPNSIGTNKQIES